MKKVLSIVMAVAMLMTLCVFGVSAAEGGTLTVGSTTAQRGDTIKVDVVLANNPGMNAMTLEPVYDAAVLEFTGFDNPEFIGEGEEADENPWYGEAAERYVWAKMGSDTTANGVVVGLTFTVKADATLGATEVSVLFDGSNKDEQTPAIEVVAGKVMVDDPNAGHLTVDSAYALPGETVTLNVVLTNNPGMNAMTLEPVYDAAVLEFVGFNNPEFIGEGEEAEENPWYGEAAERYVWAKMGSDTTANGVVVGLTFKVLDTVAIGTKTEVSVIFDGSNKDELTPEVVVVAGGITVDEEPVTTVTTVADETTVVDETTAGDDGKKDSPATADMGIAVAAVALAAAACFVATKKRK